MGVGKRGEEAERSRPGQEFMELEVLWECFVCSGLDRGFLKENTLGSNRDGEKGLESGWKGGKGGLGRGGELGLRMREANPSGVKEGGIVAPKIPTERENPRAGATAPLQESLDPARLSQLPENPWDFAKRPIPGSFRTTEGIKFAATRGDD